MSQKKKGKKERRKEIRNKRNMEEPKDSYETSSGYPHRRHNKNKKKKINLGRNKRRKQTDENKKK